MLGKLIAAICVVAVFIPWLGRSLADGSINTNGLILNFMSTIQEIITREPTNWRPPAPPAGNGGQL